MRKAFTTQPDVRDQILTVAEGLFRQKGYSGTTIADIAGACEMSPANVYRFFESKATLCQAITGIALKRIESIMQEIAGQRNSASDRMRALVLTSHEITCKQCLQNNQLHELTVKALKQQWPVIEAHIERVRVIFKAVIADGVRAGEFACKDIDLATDCAFNAMWGICHPQLVAERLAFDDGRQARAMAEFIVQGLRCSAQVQARVPEITA